MMSAYMPSEAEYNEFNDLRQTKLLLDKSVHVIELNQWQSFPVTLMNDFLHFLLK